MKLTFILKIYHSSCSFVWLVSNIHSRLYKMHLSMILIDYFFLTQTTKKLSYDLSHWKNVCLLKQRLMSFHSSTLVPVKCNLARTKQSLIHEYNLSICDKTLTPFQLCNTYLEFIFPIIIVFIRWDINTGQF